MYLASRFLFPEEIKHDLRWNRDPKEVAALSTTPGGLPGSSVLFLVTTRTSSPAAAGNAVQACTLDAPTPAQKLVTILSASFSILFLPSMLDITGIKSN